MDSIVLKKIVKKNNVLYYEYDITEGLEKFFAKDKTFYIEYPASFNFNDVPDEILSIPFAMNMLPLIWISGSRLYIDKLEKNFYNSTINIKKELAKMYKNANFSGDIIVNSIKEIDYYIDERKTTLLFSGGVDAVSSLMTHYNENPTLFYVYGADLNPNDIANYNKIKEDFRYTNNLGFKLYFIRSSLRYSFNEKFLSEYWFSKLHDTWWHGMQHSIGLISLLAPYNYQNNISINYIASSYTKEDIGIINCISYPFIDNSLQIGNSKTIHDGFEFTRLNKIENIIKNREVHNISNIPLKVCFNIHNGENCCKCEKCLRTMFAIHAMNENVKYFGFNPDYKSIGKRLKYFCDNNIIDVNALHFWEETQKYIVSNNILIEDLQWVKNYKFNTYKKNWYHLLVSRFRILGGKLRKHIFLLIKKEGNNNKKI